MSNIAFWPNPGYLFLHSLAPPHYLAMTSYVICCRHGLDISIIAFSPNIGYLFFQSSVPPNYSSMKFYTLVGTKGRIFLSLLSRRILDNSSSIHQFRPIIYPWESIHLWVVVGPRADWWCRITIIQQGVLGMLIGARLAYWYVNNAWYASCVANKGLVLHYTIAVSACCVIWNFRLL